MTKATKQAKVLTLENRWYEGRGLRESPSARSTATSPNLGPYPSAHSQLSEIVQNRYPITGTPYKTNIGRSSPIIINEVQIIAKITKKLNSV